MYVEEVCIDGFKSYAQRTVVPAFDPLFNAITGLNGSGKSNILDAICFVLGITNLSQVRRRHGLSDENAPKRTKTVLFPFPKIRVFSRLRDRSRRLFFLFFLRARRRRNIDSYASRAHLTPFPCIARQQQRRH